MTLKMKVLSKVAIEAENACDTSGQWPYMAYIACADLSK